MTISSHLIRTALDDGEAAIERHVEGRLDETEARRGFNESLDCIYRAFSALKDRPGFFAEAAESVEGRTLLAVVWVRGKTVHRLIEPSEGEWLLPSPGVYPSPDLYSDLNYSWLVYEVLEDFITPTHQQEKSNGGSSPTRATAPRWKTYCAGPQASNPVFESRAGAPTRRRLSCCARLTSSEAFGPFSPSKHAAVLTLTRVR